MHWFSDLCLFIGVLGRVDENGHFAPRFSDLAFSTAEQ